MAHIYHGSDGLILTAAQKENFPSGLQRIDCTFRCRTTNADTLSLGIVSGHRLPGYNNFIIAENAKRTDGTDGFSTFSVSGFYASLVTTPNATNPLPSTLGASLVQCPVTVESTSISCESEEPPCVAVQVVTYQSFQIYILSDTLTLKFTLNKNDSVTTLALPIANLKFRVLYVLNTTQNAGGVRMTLDQLDALLGATASFSSSYSGTMKQRLSGAIDIINVQRSNFGEYDEVTVTWGLSFPGISFSLSTDFRGVN
jgi:hypothetical protein